MTRMPKTSAAPFVPPDRSLIDLARAAARCRGCPLWKRGTQTVFGEGSPRAEMMLIGEQPGDKEDLEGRPFIGPAGRLLDEALEEAGIDRKRAYVTNAVKHFKWEPAGKRRIHKKPSASEVAACRPWLEAEIESLEPVVLVCLGSTAAQSVLGPSVRVNRDRGRLWPTRFGRPALVTAHPSSVLRAPTEAARADGRRRLVADLAVIARASLSRGRLVGAGRP